MAKKKTIKRNSSYGWEKLSSAVHCLTGYGERKERLAYAASALHNTEILRHPKIHLPKEIRDEYVEFVRKMSSVKATDNEGDFVATVNSLDEAALGQAEKKIISFYDTICRYQEPFGNEGW